MISFLTNSKNSESKIRRKTSFDFKAVQFLLDAHNIARPDPEETSMEYKKLKLFRDVTMNNLVSFKNNKGLMGICKQLYNLGDLRFNKMKIV